MVYKWPPLRLSAEVDRSRRFVFTDALWLGGKRDGHPLTEFDNYCRPRAPDDALGARAALLQHQLTFGLLETVTEQRVPESQLLKIVDGQTYLTDTNIFGMMVDWHKKIRSVTDKRDNCSYAERVGAALNAAHSKLQKEMTTGVYSSYNSDALNLLPNDLYLIVASCGAIAETIIATAQVSFRLGSVFHGKWPGWHFVHEQSQYQTNRMVRKGWCPFTIHMLKSLGVSAYNYASTRGPFLPAQHKPNYHVGCTPHACKLTNVDVSTYRTKHIEESCECPFLSPPIEYIRELLTKGEIPVIFYDPTSPDVLTVFPSTKVPYVSISHVWVDGLGSTSEAGLPTCQLRKLADSTHTLLPEGGAFWIDSLCVPKVKDLRSTAIRLMAETYRGASTTLVIDAAIRAGSQSAPKVEKVLRIVTSNWMHRLWTLQEAWLARNLVFELKDGFMPAHDIVSGNEDGFDATFLTLARVPLELIKPCGTTELCSVGAALTWRSSSRPEDETLAIAGLFDIDAAKLADLPPNERMKEFFIAKSELPREIIFLDGPKLTEPGFRWAPRTMMVAKDSKMISEGGAVCRRDGLIAEYAVAWTSEDIIADTHTVTLYVLRDVQKNRAFIVRNMDGVESGYTFNSILMKEFPDVSKEATQACIAVKSIDVDKDGGLVCECRGRLTVRVTPLSEADCVLLGLDTPLMRLTPVLADSGRLRVRLV